jgi:hypothetical protein
MLSKILNTRKIGKKIRQTGRDRSNKQHLKRGGKIKFSETAGEISFSDKISV